LTKGVRRGVGVWLLTSRGGCTPVSVEIEPAHDSVLVVRGAACWALRYTMHMSCNAVRPKDKLTAKCSCPGLRGRVVIAVFFVFLAKGLMAQKVPGRGANVCRRCRKEMACGATFDAVIKSFASAPKPPALQAHDCSAMTRISISRGGYS